MMEIIADRYAFSILLKVMVVAQLQHSYLALSNRTFPFFKPLHYTTTSPPRQLLSNLFFRIQHITRILLIMISCLSSLIAGRKRLLYQWTRVTIQQPTPTFTQLVLETSTRRAVFLTLLIVFRTLRYPILPTSNVRTCMVLELISRTTCCAPPLQERILAKEIR